MSAIRRNGNRASTRNNVSSPYRRSAPKKSGWSLTGLLSYLNPLRSRPTTGNEPEESSSEDESSESEAYASHSEAAQNLSARGRQMASTSHQVNNAGVHPIQQRTTSLRPPASRGGLTDANPISTQFTENSTPEQNLRIASDFLRENLDRQMTRVELEGVLSLIDKSKPVERPEPFRFSSTVPSTPPRGNSPLLPNGTGNPFDMSVKSPPQATTKLLSRNPNGIYRWQGGGSAKANRSRNRYTSPAFGPTAPSSSRIVLKSTGEMSRNDSKRRRVDEPQTSTASSGSSGSGINGLSVPRSPAPEPTPGRVSHAQSLPPPQPPTTPTKSTGPSSSRLRLSVPPKPTTPAIPSPLRNAWSNNSPDASPPQPTRQTKQTKAANFMTELIKEATPPKKPDVSNPYQTASPVIRAGVVKPRPKRPRAVEKKPEKKPEPPQTKEPKEEIQDLEKEYPPQAILEATRPKGSKRSRPPVHLEQASTSSSQKSHEEVAPSDASEPEEAGPVSKKSKPTLEGLGRSSVIGKPQQPAVNGRDATTKESNDVEMPESPPKPVERQKSPPPAQSASVPSLFTRPTSPTSPSTGRTLGSFKPTAPKEPSKLRFSYQPEPSTSVTTSRLTSIFPPAAPATTTTTPEVPLFQQPTDQDKVAKETLDPKQVALAKPVTSLPSYTFPTIIPNPTSLNHLPAISKVKGLPKTSLPTYDFKASSSSGPSSASTSAPVKAFNWAAAGMKPPAKGAWNCSVCMLDNTADAIDKCNFCDEPRPSSSVAKPPPAAAAAPSAVPKTFDWTGAGMKPPSTSADGGWTCSTCLGPNPATATVRCLACEEPKPGSNPDPKPADPTPPALFAPPTAPVVQFNYAAAGMKVPSIPADRWTCSLCGITNPNSETKCSTCETPR
ncbi:hypothetical protein BDN72DRAFT_955300 [Pluteus cervinus]|uniref:Uncharacterized protein n=1 Tax=Pluteus cervinus TaxID=181527 RepID=A0ACD3BAA6_9AGAR|nr:hypothetical protein BDN72DRAFT_955300 [Pluteus cervinus]